MRKRVTTTYTEEQKEALLKRMLPPQNTPITVVSEETGISKSTLNTWKRKAQDGKNGTSQAYKVGKDLSSKEKFLIVMETYSMPEIKLAEYCRIKGLYVEQVKKWRETCMVANGQENEIYKDLRAELQEDKKKIKILEKDLNRKEKALAETAALLVLRKKLGAIFGDQEEE
ncbi:transposase [Pseudobacteroides cellulosolvens]|uniref:Transposase IS3/IS911 family protein n=1 Tax=Pseudobacteroides cellulosolvens ATCC 35603 = DSM 2933 TaxID=398512 RepID=A0A0L6JS16_9FIRM|nr:transposase [Pseudobacteroides cellulosolvens]KNY28187.1 transposase IS3/IS911 family protein [Pseudobacteroides cellulosolvens ATCC 35603 = DSM 2933]